MSSTPPSLSSSSSWPLYHQKGWDESSSSSFPYLALTLAFTVFVFLVEISLDIRQLRRFSHNDGLHPKLQGHVKQETFDKAIAYRRDLFSFKLVDSTLSLLLSLAFMLGGCLPFLWDTAASLALSLGIDREDRSALVREAAVTWLFVALFVLQESLLSLPTSLYSTFVIEERHGFNKTTLGLFLQDRLLSLFLSLLLCLPVIPAMVWIIRWGGPHFPLFLWLFLCLLSLLLLTIYPVLIAPLFNKYTPLEEGPVRAAIESLAQSVDFPLTNLFKVDGSRRSAHSNAYFYGFFKNKRIVLYDTLLSQVDLEELLAILGHEIGHWKLWHTLQGFVISQAYTLALFSAFSHLQSSPALFASFGFAYREEMPVFIGLLLFTQTFWGPVDKILSLLLTFNSRSNEFAADAFAVSLGKGRPLASGLIKISIENLDNLVPDRWYSLYHYSHPPLVERLEAIDRLLETSQKKTT